MMSHINSYVREASDDKTSYELMTRRFGIEFADLFNIKRIPANEIILKPSLLDIEQKVDTLKFFGSSGMTVGRFLPRSFI